MTTKGPDAASSDALVALIRERDAHTVHAALGIRYTSFGAERTVVEVDVSERLLQHGGVVHGGVYALLMESAASASAAFSVDITRTRVAGQELSASHVRGATTGTLRCEARLVHGGRTSRVYACDVDNDGKLVSTGRVTLALRELAP